jgi:hypothetical protein
VPELVRHEPVFSFWDEIIECLSEHVAELAAAEAGGVPGFASLSKARSLLQRLQDILVFARAAQATDMAIGEWLN